MKQTDYQQIQFPNSQRWPGILTLGFWGDCTQYQHKITGVGETFGVQEHEELDPIMFSYSHVRKIVYLSLFWDIAGSLERIVWPISAWKWCVLNYHQDEHMEGYWPQPGSTWVWQEAVLHQYQILNWKNVCVSQGGWTDGLLDESAVLVIDGQRGAVRGKLCHIMSTSGCFPLVHS